MQKLRSLGSAKRQGFTLAEMLIASGMVALLIMANMGALYTMRIMGYKDMERGVVSGFMQHYVELVKALPFDHVMPNEPVSGLYNGANGTPRIAIPVNGNWVDMNTVAYQTFHPGLLWITNRQPQLRVVVETSYNGAVAHDKHVSVEIKWDAPLRIGAQLTRRLDLFRVKDL